MISGQSGGTPPGGVVWLSCLFIVICQGIDIVALPNSSTFPAHNRTVFAGAFLIPQPRK